MGRPLERFTPVRTGNAAIDRAQDSVAQAVNGLLLRDREATGSIDRDIRHASRKLVLVPASGGGNSAAVNVTGYVQATSGAGHWIQTVPLSVGDRITSISFWHDRASSGTSTFKLQRFRMVDGDLADVFSFSVTTGTSYEKVTRDYEHTIADGYGYQLEWDAAASGDLYYGAQITYDRP